MVEATMQKVHWKAIKILWGNKRAEGIDNSGIHEFNRSLQNKKGKAQKLSKHFQTQKAFVSASSFEIHTNKCEINSHSSFTVQCSYKMNFKAIK